MQRLRILCALVATLAQHAATAPGYIGREPEAAEATDVLQFKRLPHNVKPAIEESHQWKGSHDWMPNPYVRRRPKQGILFLPKHTTSQTPAYFSPKIASGKRCADDFDCMHVLGQVCKRRRRGNTGNCECPEPTPVKLDDEAQPRCVAARHVFEECADSVECSFFNPHVECINQICTCQPPNILKSKDVCMPAQDPSHAAKIVGWIVSAIIVVAILIAIILGARKLVRKNYVDDLMGPTFHSQYWREDRPNMWENVRASLAEMRDKFRSAALGRRDIIGVPGQETRVTTYVPAPRAKPHARHVHQTTVRVDVHRAQSPDEDAPDVIETLLALDAPDESDSGPLSPTSRDVMLAQEPGYCKEPSVARLAVRRPKPVADRDGAPKGAANASKMKRVSAASEEPKKRLGGVCTSPQLLFDSESEAERIMSIVLDQLALEREGLAQAHHSTKNCDDKNGAKATPVGGSQSEDDEVIEAPCQKKTTFDGPQVSGILRSIYSHTLVTLRNKLMVSNAHPTEVDSMDNESYGDTCKPREEKDFAEGSADLCLTQKMSGPDKGGGEDKSKVSPESPTCRENFSRATRDNGSSKNYVSSPNLGKQRPRKPGDNHGETTSEHKFLPHLMEASLLGAPLDTVLDSCKSFVGPTDAAAVDAYSVAQYCTLPEQEHRLKQGKNDGCFSGSYQSFSDSSRSRFWKGSRKLPGGPSFFSQSTSHCATDRKGATLKASEKLSKAGDTLKSFMSSMYPASLAATSTRSAGCFHTAYSEVPQQSGYTADHQEPSSKPVGPKKTQRVHYYDADCDQEPSQNRGVSHESVASLAHVSQSPTNKAQPGTPGSVTKKKNILKNASSNLGPRTAPKTKKDHEEERPLLLNSAEVPGRGESIGKVSDSNVVKELAGEDAQEDAIQSNATKHLQQLALADSSVSPVAGLDKKILANEGSEPSSSKTSVVPSSASNRHTPKLTTSPTSPAGPEKGTKKSPSSKSRASPDHAALISENLESMKEKDALKDMQAIPSTASLLQGPQDIEGAFPRAAHLAKLKLPFGVPGCDAKGQWSKAVDKQPGRIQTPLIFSPNEPNELLEDNLACEAKAVVRAPPKSTRSHTSARKQVSRDDVINLNITEAELINCINKLVGSTVTQEIYSDRKFPKFHCTQMPVSGCQLMRDAILYDEEVSDEVTGKKGLPKGGKRCSEASSDALNRPLSSLRRGDLKNMLKEILEEEYSHLLHMSAQIQRDGTTDTRTSLPFSTCGNDESDNTSETTSEASTSRTSVGENETPDDASTSARDTVVAGESRSTELSSAATAMARATITPDVAGTREAQAEGAMTATNSNAGDTSVSNTSVGSRSARSVTGALSNEARGQVTSSLTDARVQGRRVASLPLEHLGTVPVDGYRPEAVKQARSHKASTATSRQGSGTTTVSTFANSSSIEHVHTAGAYSADHQSARLLSDVSIQSSSLSKPPQSVTPVVGIAGIHVRPQQNPAQLFVPHGEWEHMMSFEHVKTHRVSWSPPMYRTITDTEASAFAYADEMVPFPEMKPPIDFSPSQSNPSLMIVQQGLKPLPESRLVNLSESYVPFSNWSYQPDTPEMDREEKERQPLPEECSLPKRGQSIRNKEPENSEQKDLSAKTTVPVSIHPKSASFHGFSAKHNKSSSAVKTKQRTKSHTDYWLKTVALYQELTTDQMSSSGVTCSDASGTNTMFEPDQIEALERSRYQTDTLDRLPLSTEGVNPLLETFLRMQNEAPYTPTPGQTSTYCTDSPVERTPREARDEAVGSGALFDTSIGDYSLMQRFLASSVAAYETGQTQWKSTDRSGPQKRTVVRDNKSVQRRGTLTTDVHQQQGRSLETGSPIVYAVDDEPSYEDSSATSFSEAKKVKALRKTAPYRTPFPLCSSSTAGSRYNAKAVKKNWKQRMASVAVPNVGARATRASRAEAEQERGHRPTRSETVLLADTRQESFQNTLSALENVDGENFLNYKSLQLQEWLNQAAHYAPFEEGRPEVHLAPAQRSGYRHDRSSASSEYYEAEPTTDTGGPTSQHELTDDPNNWQ